MLFIFFSSYDIIKNIEKGDNMTKVGMILEGGSLRGIFTTGVLDVMLENNIEIDDIYRNENGITMQFNIMQSLLCNKESGLHNASKLFVEMKDLYYQNNSEYKKILNTLK